MKIVYFNPELSAQAPDLLGVFYADPSGKCLEPGDIGDALAAGENVDIRQASPAEIERAEAIVILHGIELQLAQQLGGLLDPIEPISATWSIAADALTAGAMAE